MSDADRALSDPQKRALTVLSETPRWVTPGGRWGRTNTLDALHRRGLIDRRLASFPFEWRYRINDEGRAMVAATGN